MTLASQIHLNIIKENIVGKQKGDFARRKSPLKFDLELLT